MENEKVETTIGFEKLKHDLQIIIKTKNGWGSDRRLHPFFLFFMFMSRNIIV